MIFDVVQKCERSLQLKELNYIQMLKIVWKVNIGNSYKQYKFVEKRLYLYFCYDNFLQRGYRNGSPSTPNQICTYGNGYKIHVGFSNIVALPSLHISWRSQTE